MCQSGTRYSHITAASGFSSVWVQTWPSCISAATKVVLNQRLQSLLFLSPGWIQSSVGVDSVPCFGKKIQIYPRTVRKCCVVFRIVIFHITRRNFRKNIYLCWQWKNRVSNNQGQQSEEVSLIWKTSQSTLFQKNHAEQRWEHKWKKWYLTSHTVCIHYCYMYIY